MTSVASLLIELRELSSQLEAVVVRQDFEAATSIMENRLSVLKTLVVMMNDESNSQYKDQVSKLALELLPNDQVIINTILKEKSATEEELAQFLRQNKAGLMYSRFAQK